jgi:hypothetical protein
MTKNWESKGLPELVGKRADKVLRGISLARLKKPWLSVTFARPTQSFWKKLL